MPNNEVFILTNFESPRLHYVLYELFNRRLGLQPIIIFHISAYNNTAPLIVYGNFSCAAKHIKLKNWDFLHRHTIEPIDDTFVLSNNITEIDPFTATFLVLSRYEEYLPFNKNKLDSYPYNKSLAFKCQLHQQPLVDIWANELAETLKNTFHFEAFNFPVFKKTLTVDVDIAFAYKGRSLGRTILATGKDFLSFKFKGIIQRFKVLQNKAADPFDTFETLFKDSSHFDETIFFFPAGANDRFNRHLPINALEIRKLLKRIPKNIEIGLHPIKQKNKTPQLLKKELTNLESETNGKITKSRQHYLNFIFPKTFTDLLNAGIIEDYSIGYNEINGFRASTCQSFNFYNVLEDKVTDLICHPLIAMDAVYVYNQQITVHDAINETIALIDLCKKFNGDFIIDFHNNHIQPSHAWHNYYVQILQYLQKN